MDSGSYVPSQSGQTGPAPSTPGGAGPQPLPPASPYGAPFPPAPSQPQRPRKNWTPCYITACVSLLILAAVLIALTLYLGKKFGGSFFGDVMSFGVKMQELQSTVASTPLESIREQAQPVTVAELATNPGTYAGQWLAVTGTLIAEPTQSSSQTSFGPASSGMNGMMYQLSPGVIMIDISGAPAVAHAGDTVTGYGQALELNMGELTKLPVVGQAMQQEMQKDPALQQSLQMQFIIAKVVELVSTAAPAAPDGDAATFTPSAETQPPPS